MRKTVKGTETFLLAAVIVVFSAPLYLLAIDLSTTFIRLSSGLVAFGALAALLPLSIIELVAIIGTGALLRRARSHRELLRRFATLLSIEFLLFALLELGRFAMFRPLLRGDMAGYKQLREPWIFIPAAVCGVIGLLTIVVLLVTRGRRSEQNEAGRG